MKYWAQHIILAGSFISAEFLNWLPKLVGLVAALIWLLVAWQTWRNKKLENKILEKKLKNE